MEGISLKTILSVLLRFRTFIIISRLSKYYFYVTQLKVHNQKRYKGFSRKMFLDFCPWEVSRPLSFSCYHFFVGMVGRVQFPPLVLWNKMVKGWFSLFVLAGLSHHCQGSSCKVVHVSDINVILLNFMHCISGLYCRLGHGLLVFYIFGTTFYLPWTQELGLSGQALRKLSLH